MLSRIELGCLEFGLGFLLQQDARLFPSIVGLLIFLFAGHQFGLALVEALRRETP